MNDKNIEIIESETCEKCSFLSICIEKSYDNSFELPDYCPNPERILLEMIRSTRRK